MSEAAFTRVWKQMIQMFGPQWSEKWGTTNETWAAALKELTYAQVTEGLRQVRNGALKYYEVDLPNFLMLCRPVAPPAVTSYQPRAMADWAKGMPQDEVLLHRAAGIFLFQFLLGPTTDNGRATDEQINECVRSLHRLAHEFYEMRKELGADAVPDSDLKLSLYRQWRRDLSIDRPSAET